MKAIHVFLILCVGWGAAACGDGGAVETQSPPPAATSGSAGSPSLAPQAPTAAAAGSTAQPSAPSAPTSSGSPPAAGSAAPSKPTTTTTTPPTAAAGAAAPPQVTPSDEMWCGVKRTLDAKCTSCHNEQKFAGAPMSLKAYADTQAAAVSDGTKKVFSLIGTRVHDTAKPMPPQGKLTDAELAGIDAWVAAGAPSAADPTCGGNATAEPEDDGWTWPTNCDATYKVVSHGSGGPGTPHVVPGSQETHPNVSIAAPWGNEEVQMIAWRAVVDNPRVLHHWILYGPRGEHIVGWSPGKQHNAPMPPDVGMYLPSGNLRLNMHYNNLLNSTDEPDQSGLEVCVLKRPNMRPKTATTFTGFSQFAINLAPHATNVEVTGTCNVTATQPVTILSASPHAHRFGHHMRFTVQRANGETVSMHDSEFNYEEQGSYDLEPPVVVNTGDKVITTCVFTNTSDATVRFGENTEDEMCFNFAVYYPMGALSCGLGGGGFPRL